MELDKTAKQAVRELGDAINAAVEKSTRVAEAINALRELGYEPNLTLKLEIGLMEISENVDDFPEDIELDLTDEDVKTLRRMKIKF
jgi:pentose-5-phosphate-3-epimerase